MATPSPIFHLQATGLWAVGDLLGEPKDLETVTVALAVNLQARSGRRRALAHASDGYLDVLAAAHSE